MTLSKGEMLRMNMETFMLDSSIFFSTSCLYCFFLGMFFQLNDYFAPSPLIPDTVGVVSQALAKSELIERDGLVCIEYPREIGEDGVW